MASLWTAPLVMKTPQETQVRCLSKHRGAQKLGGCLVEKKIHFQCSSESSCVVSNLEVVEGLLFGVASLRYVQVYKRKGLLGYATKVVEFVPFCHCKESRPIDPPSHSRVSVYFAQLVLIVRIIL